ncbi:MAG: ATP-grasp domain-containing protein, partial [Coriobacteriia bacterium]|nr:ATP-grasp domain-containing protein [Coriobacteriia bacterium]
MRLLVLGGQLQGTEITYLAKEAGWTVSVVDKREGVLASRLCDHFICLDILQASPDLFCGFDLVLPALEDLSVLKRVLELTQEAEVPFAFDWQAFVLSRSKIRSNIFLEDLGVRVPLPIEECVLENQKTSAELSGNSKLEQCYIVKPNCSSGSKGVERYRDINAAYARICADPSEGLFGQVFLEGPIYSIEVICNYQLVKPYMVTEVVVDDEYHSHRILAPAPISIELIEKIEDLGMKIGSALNMKGIFDIEMV